MGGSESRETDDFDYDSSTLETTQTMVSSGQIRERVTSTRELQEADMLAFPRNVPGNDDWVLYWHFAIVESLNHSKNTINAIHFDAGYGGAADLAAKGDASIRRAEIGFGGDEIYVVRLDPALCFRPADVISRARSKLGEKQYNLVANNCEHFAIWCKTGVSYSSQVVDAVKASIGLVTKLAEALHQDQTDSD